jgi:hypothetical protein
MRLHHYTKEITETIKSRAYLTKPVSELLKASGKPIDEVLLAKHLEKAEKDYANSFKHNKALVNKVAENLAPIFKTKTITDPYPIARHYGHDYSETKTTTIPSEKAIDDTVQRTMAELKIKEPNKIAGITETANPSEITTFLESRGKEYKLILNRVSKEQELRKSLTDGLTASSNKGRSIE